ncbi:MAG: hypothetical protein CME06_09995 [Gemmatimonadetes bacterium]|nr:hypothetical protein [Gemmatimonadota bacterium]
MGWRVSRLNQHSQSARVCRVLDVQDLEPAVPFEIVTVVDSQVHSTVVDLYPSYRPQQPRPMHSDQARAIDGSHIQHGISSVAQRHHGHLAILTDVLHLPRQWHGARPRSQLFSSPIEEKSALVSRCDEVVTHSHAPRLEERPPPLHAETRLQADLRGVGPADHPHQRCPNEDPNAPAIHIFSPRVPARCAARPPVPRPQIVTS